MVGSYRIEGTAVLETLTALQDLVTRVRVEHPELDELDLSMVETALVELVSNVVEHGQPPREVTYVLEVSVHDDRIECHLVDSGVEPVDIAGRVEMPDLDVESGRGLPMARAVLDELRYERADDANVWTMVRRLGATR